MLPPDGDPRTWLGLDDAGGHWLLDWGLPGAPGMWSALGKDHRRYPCCRTLVGEFEKMIVRFHPLPAEAGEASSGWGLETASPDLIAATSPARS